jgi:hypothetical protein
MKGWRSAFRAGVALVLVTGAGTGARAQEAAEPRNDAGGAAPRTGQLRTERAELALGVLDHGVRWVGGYGREYIEAGPFFSQPFLERGTADVMLLYRTPPIRGALKPRLTAKVQVNTGGRTSFASVGAEWRQHFLGDRVYAQVGIGVTVHDGYVNLVNPDAFPPTTSEGRRARRIFATRTAFGSPVLLNPNLSAGVRIDRRWAVEATLEHYSHNNWAGDQNPGIDTVGLRLVRTLGRGR